VSPKARFAMPESQKLFVSRLKIGERWWLQEGVIWRLLRPNRRKMLIALSIILPLLIILQIWVTNRLSTSGERISYIERLKSELMLENQLLENQIAIQSSLMMVRKYAGNLGFIPSREVEYLK